MRSRSGANRKLCRRSIVGGSCFANFGALALFGHFGMAVGLLQDLGLLHRLLEPAFTSEQEHERVERDAQIQPERGVVHIPIVERAFFFGGYEIAAVDLRPTGNLGADQLRDQHSSTFLPARRKAFSR
jgi:hypothetical protein